MAGCGLQVSACIEGPLGQGGHKEGTKRLSKVSKVRENTTGDPPWKGGVGNCHHGTTKNKKPREHREKRIEKKKPTCRKGRKKANDGEKERRAEAPEANEQGVVVGDGGRDIASKDRGPSKGKERRNRLKTRASRPIQKKQGKKKKKKLGGMPGGEGNKKGERAKQSCVKELR